MQEHPKIINSFIHLFHHDVLNFYIQSEKNHLWRSFTDYRKQKIWAFFFMHRDSYYKLKYISSCLIGSINLWSSTCIGLKCRNMVPLHLKIYNLYTWSKYDLPFLCKFPFSPDLMKPEVLCPNTVMARGMGLSWDDIINCSTFNVIPFITTTQSSQLHQVSTQPKLPTVTSLATSQMTEHWHFDSTCAAFHKQNCKN